MKRLIPSMLITFLSFGALAEAQNTPAVTKPVLPSDPASEELGLIMLEFPGGTVEQYIEAIRQASRDANIVVIGDAAPIRMPAVKLQNVDTWAAVCILNSMPNHQDDMALNVQAEITSDEPDQSRVYTVTIQADRMGQTRAAVESTVMSVADVLQGDITADDLLTAVKIAIDVVGMADEPADIKFHKETGLLIARGSISQIVAIRQVVEQLREQMQPPKITHENLAQAAAGYRQALMERDSQLEALQQRITRLETQISQLLSKQ